MSVIPQRKQRAKRTPERSEQSRILGNLQSQGKRESQYRRAVSKLPDSASPNLEINWVRNHPLMSKMDREIDPSKATKIILQWRDVEKCDHGPAPSKAAVNMLQHFCNRPDKFFAKVLDEQKKTTKEDSTVASEDTAEEIKNIDELLKSLAFAVVE